MDRQTSNHATVIAGAGQAASEAAFALRQKGYPGRVTMLGDEHYPPYQRPPLSKGYLAGKMDLEALYLKADALYARQDVELRTRTRVARIDRSSKEIALESGEMLRYDSLILATGGRPRLLNVAGHGSTGSRPTNLHYLRTADDALLIRECLAPGRRIVIVGGGYIGLEVAATAASAGTHVTVLEAQSRVLARVTAPEMSEFYSQMHTGAGVEIRLCSQVEAFELDTSGTRVRAVVCSDGTVIAADAVVVGIGLVPNIELAAAAGLSIDNGIATDADGRTSDPDIFAIGDCSSRPSTIYGRRIRLESVPAALEHARAAAAALCGAPRPAEAVPWFWSDQYDVKLQIVGLSEGYDQLIVRGSPSKRQFVAFYVKQNRVVAADAVNAPAVFMQAKRVVAQQWPLVDIDALGREDAQLQAAFEVPAH